MIATSLRGEYRFCVLDAQRNVVRETDWMPNLITNIGLDRIGAAAAVGQYCRIGTGNTAPANSDTQLVSQSASTTTIVATTNSNAGAPNYQTQATTTYEYALGAVVGNMAEVGIGWAATGASLFSRALIVDGGGSPTTISVLATEILQVVYRLNAYPNLTDSTGSVTIGGVSYNYTSRTSQAGTVLSIQPTVALLTNISSATAYSSTIGATTGVPSGTASSVTPGSFLTYTSGNYYRDYTISATLTQGNLGGIKSLALTLGGSGSVFLTQIEFNNVIPKDNTKVMSITLRQPWSRH